MDGIVAGFDERPKGTRADAHVGEESHHAAAESGCSSSVVSSAA